MTGRHPTDAAFLLDAPFHDPESELDLQYCVGTYPGGSDVLSWEIMEGPTVVRVVTDFKHFYVQITLSYRFKKRFKA